MCGQFDSELNFAIGEHVSVVNSSKQVNQFNACSEVKLPLGIQPSTCRTLLPASLVLLISLSYLTFLYIKRNIFHLNAQSARKDSIHASS
jgi:hypothetical protein